MKLDMPGLMTIASVGILSCRDSTHSDSLITSSTQAQSIPTVKNPVNRGALEEKLAKTEGVLKFPIYQRLSAGADHTCFINSAKKLSCWGDNLFGAIGNGEHGWTGDINEGSGPQGYAPRPYSGYAFDEVRLVSAAYGQTCAITETNNLFCWGTGEGPQRYDHRFVDQPVKRPTKTPIITVDAAGPCVIGVDLKLYCGLDSVTSNKRDTLGRGGETSGFYDFKRVPGLTGEVLDVATSNESTCALTSDHTVWCWGGNSYGELGKSKGPSNPTPSRLPGIRATVIASGSRHFCSLERGESQVTCWGANWDEQLGVKRTDSWGAPTPVELPSAVHDVALSPSSTIVLLNSGEVYGWGQIKQGILGRLDGERTPVPSRISGLDRIIQIATGASHACALREDETVWCWGQGDDYQLGNGKNEDSFVPVQVIFPKAQ
jgi:alpha-tubulin suppressor-like RCC1 family protein